MLLSPISEQIELPLCHPFPDLGKCKSSDSAHKEQYKLFIPSLLASAVLRNTPP
nr:MAG TPA: hypothetical protein [Bacteriophage sp.]